MGALPTKYDSLFKGKSKVLITIQYCGGWGSRVFYLEAKKFLYEQPFGRYIEVKGIKDVQVTHNFEIRLSHPWKKKPKSQNESAEENLQILLHSKSRRKRRGDWLLRTSKEREALVRLIDEILLEPRPDQISRSKTWATFHDSTEWRGWPVFEKPLKLKTVCTICVYDSYLW